MVSPYTVQLLAADTAFFHFFTYPLSGTPMKAPMMYLLPASLPSVYLERKIQLERN